MIIYNNCKGYEINFQSTQQICFTHSVHILQNIIFYEFDNITYDKNVDADYYGC